VCVFDVPTNLAKLNQFRFEFGRGEFVAIQFTNHVGAIFFYRLISVHIKSTPQMNPNPIIKSSSALSPKGKQDTWRAPWAGCQSDACSGNTGYWHTAHGGAIT
jgi:hypothetical protein